MMNADSMREEDNEGPSRTTSGRSVLSTQAVKVSSPDGGLINVGHYIEMKNGGQSEEGKLPRSKSHDSYIGHSNVKYNVQNHSTSEKSVNNDNGNDTTAFNEDQEEAESADYVKERKRIQNLQLAKAAMGNYVHRLTKEWPTPVPEFIIDAANIKIRTMASNHYSPGDAPFKKGWLKIAKRRWWFPEIYKEQYVILDEVSLSLYTSPQHTSKPPNLKLPLGSVLRSEPLTPLTSSKEEIEEKNLSIGFELHTSDKTQYVFLTDTQENVSEWVCAIELCVVFDVCNKFCQEVARSSPEVISNPDALARLLNLSKNNDEDEEADEEVEKPTAEEEKEQATEATTTTPSHPQGGSETFDESKDKNLGESLESPK